MSQPAFDVTPFLHQEEGQHFDRKSLFEGPEWAKRARDRRKVQGQVAEEESRALLHAHRHGRVENADLRSLAGRYTLNASLLLRKLRDRSLRELHPHGANSYYTLPPTLNKATDRGERSPDRGEPTPELFDAIRQLGTRPRKERLRAVIATICAQRDWTTPAELARWVNILPENLTERHLSPMVKAGQLERRLPDTPTHAEQAYRSGGGQLPLGISRKDEE